MYAMKLLRQSLIAVSVLLLAGCTVGPQQLGLSQSQWQSLDQSQQQSLLANYKTIKQAKVNKTVYSGPNINVTVANGTAMMPPFVVPQQYVAASFYLKPGQCSRVRLKSVSTQSSVNLQACYNGLVLALDPSHYDLMKSGGTLRLSYNPIWKRGFTYRGVSSSGYVRLNQVSVTVKAISNVSPLRNVSNSSSV